MKGRVDGLKNVIKAVHEKLENLPPDSLNLYKISTNEEAEIPKLLRTPGSGRLLQGSESVRDVFNDVPLLQRPCIVVEPLGESKQIFDGIDPYLPRLSGNVALQREAL